MKKDYLLLWAIGITLAIPACTRYQDLIKSWERYEPTAFYRDYAEPNMAKPISPTSIDTNFDKELQRLKEMKKKWEDNLKEPDTGDNFYRPDPSRRSTFLPAAEDESKAAEVLAKGFTLEDLENLALVRNPGVKAADRTLKASLEAYSQVSNLDEILRQYTAFTEGLMTGIGPMEETESIGLKFPFPGVLALKGEIATQEVIISKEALMISKRTAITQSRQAYWNLLFALRAQTITREMLSLLKHLEAVAMIRYETGKTSFQDLIKIRIENDILGEDLKTIRERQRNYEVKILEILDLPPTTQVGPPVPQIPQFEVPPLNGLFPIALERRQELRQMRAMVGKMERMIEMAETMIYPPYSLGLSLFRDEEIDQVGTMRMKETFPVKATASTGAGLPRIPWYGTNEAYLRETRQRLAALREDLKKIEDETFFEVREAWFRLDRAKREESLYAERVVKLSLAALEVSFRGYETGDVTFADVIASYTGWLRANLALAQARNELGMAWADLEKAVGGRWKD